MVVIEKETIEKALTDQLVEKGYNEIEHAYLFDKVNDYMSLYETKELLIMDIQLRGVMIEWRNSETSKGYKQNDSVNLLLKTDMQMQKLLAFMGLKPIDVDVGGDIDVNDIEL